MPTRPLFGAHPLFQPPTYIAVKLLEFQGAIANLKVVPPPPDDPVQILYHFRERIAQLLSVMVCILLRTAFIAFGAGQL